MITTHFLAAARCVRCHTTIAQPLRTSFEHAFKEEPIGLV